MAQTQSTVYIPPSARTPRRRDPTELAGRPCSIALALKVVGERWALLAVREIGYGNHRFDQIARNTGAPRDILTTRLRSMEEAGVIYRERYQAHPPRFDYQLTQAGRELCMVLGALRDWGDRWVAQQPPLYVEHNCGHELRIAAHCARCGTRITGGRDCSAQFRAPGWDRAGPSTRQR